ncbi:NADPH:quinone reductase [Levilactobacillus zymae]|uniref:NADPH:quinone reductase n=1 Tax=Levilactobacillus zymae TaxID=267363 RepID=A0ABQ0X1C8_9LACO|nr:zinc-binding dehydrogenase [Levilactobacillus zymae]GEO72382.1 NADPH:quinone reductase [Levilactobacillus zymae]
MQAVVVNTAGKLVDQTVPDLPVGPHDIRVAIEAISVNPIDLKRITRIGPGDSRILGYDAVGRIIERGAAVTELQLGARVMYAGSTQRAGTYAQTQVVDARLVALAPTRVSLADTAALPLTWLTAVEILTDKLGYVLNQANQRGTLLVINGAGGAGSILTQVAHRMGLTVLATSSPQHFDWLRQHGVAVPLDYHQDLVAQVHAAGYAQVDATINLFDTGRYFTETVALARPFGHLVNLTQTTIPLDLVELQAKSLSFDWELMFTKSHYQYRLATQGQALTVLQRWLDAGIVRTTRTRTLTGPINAATLRQAHRLLGDHQMLGKLVIMNEH